SSNSYTHLSFIRLIIHDNSQSSPVQKLCVFVPTFSSDDGRWPSCSQTSYKVSKKVLTDCAPTTAYCSLIRTKGTLSIPKSSASSISSLTDRLKQFIDNVSSTCSISNCNSLATCFNVSFSPIW